MLYKDYKASKTIKKHLRKNKWYKGRTGQPRKILKVTLGYLDWYDNSWWVWYVRKDGTLGDCLERSFKAWVNK